MENKETNLIDCCVIGGSAAGLSAALILGRCNRKVLVFDDCKYRNYAVNKINGYLGFDGVNPEKFRELGRKDLEKYDVKIINLHVDKIEMIGNYGEHFFIVYYGPYAVKTKTVILATGLIDQLPDILGLRENYGSKIFHCNLCDLWEYKNRKVGIHGELGLDFALVCKTWSDDIVWFADKEPSEEEKQICRDNKIQVVWEKVLKFTFGESKLRVWVETNGNTKLSNNHLVDVVFLSLLKGQKQRSKLAEKLGLNVTKENGIECNEECETSLPGLMVCGDASRDHLLSIIAAAEGCKAAISCSSYIRKVWGK